MKNTGASIARQSMMKLVSEYLIAKDIMSFKDAVAITNVLVDWVDNGYNKEIGDRLTKIDEFIKVATEETHVTSITGFSRTNKEEEVVV